MVDNTSSIARLANRVLMVAKQESDNSEDPQFVDRVNQASYAVQESKLFSIFNTLCNVKQSVMCLLKIQCFYKNL